MLKRYGMHLVGAAWAVFFVCVVAGGFWSLSYEASRADSDGYKAGFLGMEPEACPYSKDDYPFHGRWKRGYARGFADKIKAVSP